jgi:hypothetical protein
LYNSKGAVYIFINITGYKPLLFVNMHLPIDTHDKETFGYDHRKNSLLTVMTNLKEKFGGSNPIIIMGGDMNFRINPLTGRDQLTDFLKTSENNGFSELEFPDKRGKIFTCKFDKTNESCREQPEPEQIDEGTANGEIIEQIKENVQDICGNPKRFPSRCDRFLINQPNQIKVELQKGDYISKLNSDHNALYAVLKIKPENKNEQLEPQLYQIPSGGKKYKKLSQFKRTHKRKIPRGKTRNGKIRKGKSHKRKNK